MDAKLEVRDGDPRRRARRRSATTPRTSTSPALAEYTDDIAEPVGTLHAYLGLSDRAHAEIVSIDLDAVRAAPGVVGVLTRRRHAGHNDISPVGKHDDPVFAEGKVEFHGQPMFAVIAETRDAARRAAKLAKVEYRDLPHVTDVAEAIEADYPFVTEPLKLERGEVEPALAGAPRPAQGPDAGRRAGPLLPRGA